MSEFTVYKRITQKSQLAKGSLYPIKPYELYAYLEQEGASTPSFIHFLPPDKQGSLIGVQHYL